PVPPSTVLPVATRSAPRRRPRPVPVPARAPCAGRRQQPEGTAVNTIDNIKHALTGRHPTHETNAQDETLPNGRTVGPWLYCTVCGDTRPLPAEPPADHPESMPAELPPEQEEWLAAVDRELWTKEAQ